MKKLYFYLFCIFLMGFEAQGAFEITDDWPQRQTKSFTTHGPSVLVTTKDNYILYTQAGEELHVAPRKHIHLSAFHNPTFKSPLVVAYKINTGTDNTNYRVGQLVLGDKLQVCNVDDARQRAVETKVPNFYQLCPDIAFAGQTFEKSRTKQKFMIAGFNPKTASIIIDIMGQKTHHLNLTYNHPFTFPDINDSTETPFSLDEVLKIHSLSYIIMDARDAAVLALQAIKDENIWDVFIRYDMQGDPNHSTFLALPSLSKLPIKVHVNASIMRVARSYNSWMQGPRTQFMDIDWRSKKILPAAADDPMPESAGTLIPVHGSDRWGGLPFNALGWNIGLFKPYIFFPQSFLWTALSQLSTPLQSAHFTLPFGLAPKIIALRGTGPLDTSYCALAESYPWFGYLRRMIKTYSLVFKTHETEKVIKLSLLEDPLDVRVLE